MLDTQLKQQVKQNVKKSLSSQSQIKFAPFNQTVSSIKMFTTSTGLLFVNVTTGSDIDLQQ